MVQRYFGLVWAANNPQSSFAYARFATSIQAWSVASHRRQWCPTWRFVNRNDAPEMTEHTPVERLVLFLSEISGEIFATPAGRFGALFLPSKL